MKESTEQLLQRLWDQAVADPHNKLAKEPMKFVPATTGRFKLKQRVRVVKDLPDWNKAASTKPPIGIEGVVVIGRPYEKQFTLPEGTVAVRFKATHLGYSTWGSQSIYCFIPEWALCAVRKSNKFTYKDKKLTISKVVDEKVTVEGFIYTAIKNKDNWAIVLNGNRNIPNPTIVKAKTANEALKIWVKSLRK